MQSINQIQSIFWYIIFTGQKHPTPRTRGNFTVLKSACCIFKGFSQPSQSVDVANFCAVTNTIRCITYQCFSSTVRCFHVGSCSLLEFSEASLQAKHGTYRYRQNFTSFCLIQVCSISVNMALQFSPSTQIYFRWKDKTHAYCWWFIRKLESYSLPDKITQHLPFFYEKLKWLQQNQTPPKGHIY